MPSQLDYTIAYNNDGKTVDLCKVILGGDGSYYVTAPFHPHDKAIAALITVNYARQDESLLDFTRAIEVGVLDDDARRLKLSHHPDGFLQFSGEGVLSGRDQAGNARGLGIESWPLHEPTLGPSFGLAFGDPLQSGRPTKSKPRTIVVREDDIAHMRKRVEGLYIMGFYLPVMWREYVYRTNSGEYELSIVNPGAQAVLRLRILLASKESEYPGMVGIQAMPHGLRTPEGGPGFVLTSSTGNLRRNAEGELLGDQLVCLYPRPHLDDGITFKPLNHPLPAPPYVAPPGTEVIEP